ncbi:MAG: SEC-C metal-binding domain-containing protein [Clostridia bacterium]
MSCPCGSGKAYGSCCGRNEPCACGSGKKAGECCYAG